MSEEPKVYEIENILINEKVTICEGADMEISVSFNISDQDPEAIKGFLEYVGDKNPDADIVIAIRVG